MKIKLIFLQLCFDAGQDGRSPWHFHSDHALLSGPGAVLKQSFWKQAWERMFSEAIPTVFYSTIFSVISKNVSEERAGEFLQLIQDCFLDASENGLDHKTILAAIHHDAFQSTRRRITAVPPKGLVYSLNALIPGSTEESPGFIWKRRFLYVELMEEVDKGYFESS